MEAVVAEDRTKSAPFTVPDLVPSGGNPAFSPFPSAQRFRPDCANCPVRGMCMPSSMDASEVSLLDFVVVSRRRVSRGQTLYHAGAQCDAIYPIRAGFFKSSVLSRNGDEQVTGLRMPGDILGLDGVDGGRYRSDAIALDHGEVCLVPRANLFQQSLHEQALQQALCGILGREITRQQDLVRLLGSMRSVQRVAAFLLDFSRRMRMHGYSPRQFDLRLTRRDIGSYVGVELETVSRVMSRLERDHLIVAHGPRITILDLDGLALLQADASPFAAAESNMS